MGIENAVLLAIIQGTTEFFPVSSSGHLVIFQYILGLKSVPVLFDLILHVGTVIATILIYHKVIWKILRELFLWIALKDKVKKSEILAQGNVKLISCILLSSIVTGILGFGFKDILKGLFYKPNFVSLFLILTGIILLLTRFKQKGTGNIKEINILYPITIGAVQAFAIIPGISRSGTTISTSLLMGFSRDFSGMYSFLLSIPSVIGATLFEFLINRNELMGIISLQTLVLAFMVSLITGYFSLKLLLKFIIKGNLYRFSFYCIFVGISGVLFLRLFNYIFI